MAEGDPWDVCIVGSGAGGGIVAYELARRGLKVVTLEAGPRLPDDYFSRVDPPGIAKDFGVRPETTWPSDPQEAFFANALFAAPEEASAASGNAAFRPYQIFALGGLQTLWNGVSLRFSPEDMADWSVSYEALEPHYAAVERLITVCGEADGLSDLPDGEVTEPMPWRPVDRLLAEALSRQRDPQAHALANRKAILWRQGGASDCVSSGACAFGCPVGAVYNFPRRLLPRIAGLPGYRLETGMRVTRLLAEGQRVGLVEYRDCETGAPGRLEARIVVLAAGALESPRILFNSADETDPAGLANRGDQVGRCLHDSPKTVLSTSLWRLWGRRRDYDVGYGDPLLLMARGRLPDGETFPFIGHNSQPIPAVPYYLDALRRFPSPVKRRLARLLFHSYVTVGLFCGGDPDPANRLLPSRSRDALGLPQVEIAYRSSARTQARLRAMEQWGRRLLRAASGTAIQGQSSDRGSGIHYAGTTALAQGVEPGVVDETLRCHDLENLYICDGGVIPRLPEKHLTLTIMALAHRLSAHIAARLAAGDPLR
ncbi:MAG: GMC family oxidoreductase [Rhodospirillales bacterium]